MKQPYGLQPLITRGEFPFRLLLLLIFLRTMDLLWVRSTYVPDEYWQSLEVAHNKVFGYGYLTWEWTEGIRSYVYVGLVSGVYYILKLLDLDTPEAVVIAPRIMQGIISAIADVYFLRWVHEKRNGQYSWAFISWFTTFFIAYCSTRTLINTFEMNLTIIALYYYPWTPKTNNFVFASIVTLLCFVRPTAGVIWLPLVLINLSSVRKPVMYALLSYVPNLILVGGACVALDTFMHGSLVITPWNFFKINVLKGIGSFYGTHDVLWYLYCGLPVVLGLQTLPFVIGCFRLARSRFWKTIKYNLEAQMFVTILWTIFVYSLLPHKEFRFILPLAPMMIYISSGVLSKHLNCDPNLTDDPNYVTEDELFYNNTRAWLEREYTTTRPCSLPTHVVTFSSLNYTNFFYSKNISLLYRIEHSKYFPESRQERILFKCGPNSGHIAKSSIKIRFNFTLIDEFTPD
ncbi:unnamed protein product [Nesidiocoris tenuis]|uniref:Mannosyltransferase n=1 Tax=Nesidiocoris tenuis TaxID=355587 RepID=A0A6H5HGA7_9HEMI|nr:unnamed protein product [Nesidiocoris tenuis]